MKIVITHSTKFDFYNELYLPIKNDNELMNHEFYFSEENRALNTKKVIGECDLVMLK